MLFEDVDHNRQSRLVKHVGARLSSFLPHIICLHLTEAYEKGFEYFLSDQVLVHELVLCRIDVLDYFWVLYESKSPSHDIHIDHWVLICAKLGLPRLTCLLI